MKEKTRNRILVIVGFVFVAMCVLIMGFFSPTTIAMTSVLVFCVIGLLLVFAGMTNLFWDNESDKKKKAKDNEKEILTVLIHYFGSIGQVSYAERLQRIKSPEDDADPERLDIL